MTDPAAPQPTPPPRPDWSGDDLLKPWRRKPVVLPFTTTERSETETQKRVLAFAGVTGVICSLITFGILVWAGIFPEIYRDPNITEYGDHTFVPWFILGAGVGSAVVFLVILSPIFFQSPAGPGHPWSFEATEQGLSIRNIHGQVFAGPWADWTLAGYDVLSLPKGGAVVNVLYLSLGGTELPVRVMDQRDQKRVLRMIAQKVAV